MFFEVLIILGIINFGFVDKVIFDEISWVTDLLLVFLFNIVSFSGYICLFKRRFRSFSINMWIFTCLFKRFILYYILPTKWEIFFHFFIWTIWSTFIHFFIWTIWSTFIFIYLISLFIIKAMNSILLNLLMVFVFKIWRKVSPFFIFLSFSSIFIVILFFV